MNHIQFARRLLITIFSITLLVFWLESAWDFSHAIDPATGRAVQLSDLRATPAMVRSLASSFGGAYGTMLALLLTFVSLAIPITANLYTPKLIDIFIRDPINLFVISTCAILAAHNLLAVSLSFDQWTAQIPFAIAVVGAIFGWLLLLPYYFYVVSFIDPLTIIQRVHRALMRELDTVAGGKQPVAQSQRSVDEKIHALGSVLLRAADRADRDVTLDAMRTHILEIARMRVLKPRLPAAFLLVDNELMAGMAGDTTDIVNEKKIWMEHRIAHQLVLAFKSVLGKMPDGVSAMAQAVKNAAHQEVLAGNTEVFHLLVRTLNSFTREAIKSHHAAAVCDVTHSYKALVRRLLKDQPGHVPQLVHYLRYYAEFARTQGLPFIYERLSYELCELTEIAYHHRLPPAPDMLDAVLAFEGAAHSAGLVKSRAVLGGFLAERGLAHELERVLASLRDVAPAALAQARDDILAVNEPMFWEINDHGINFDYVAPARRVRVIEVFDRLAAAAS